MCDSELVIMDIIDFFNSDTLELPKVRTATDFESYLHQCFDAYISEVYKLSGSDAVTVALKARAGDIKKLCAGICAAVGKHFDGFPHAAYEQLRDAIGIVRVSLDRLVSLDDISSHLQYLYRVRPGTLLPYSRQDLFHIPFELRHKVTTQRYSIHGLPSLYLGSSLWVCWEELGRPDFDTMHLARFKATKPIKVLDFGYRPALIAAMVNANKRVIFSGGPLTEFVTSQAVCWPLLAASSIKVLNPGSPFIPEYVVPHLILQWLRNESDWDGLRYFSTRIAQYVDDPKAAANYVFPVKQKAATGHCSNLRQTFELSEPIPWQVLRFADLPKAAPTAPPSWRLGLVPGVSIPYMHTDFWDCEAKIADFPCALI